MPPSNERSRELGDKPAFNCQAVIGFYGRRFAHGGATTIAALISPF
jgi:hypothetical protein